MSEIYLNDGDATFQKSFQKICFGESGEKYTFGFKASRGKKFVVLLLGEIDDKADDCDLDGMLGKLGFYRRDK